MVCQNRFKRKTDDATKTSLITNPSVELTEVDTQTEELREAMEYHKTIDINISSENLETYLKYCKTVLVAKTKDSNKVL